MAACVQAATWFESYEKLYAYGFSDFDVDRREPVMSIGFKAVDNGEELFVKGRSDGAHGPVAYDDAVN